MWFWLAENEVSVYKSNDAKCDYGRNKKSCRYSVYVNQVFIYPTSMMGYKGKQHCSRCHLHNLSILDNIRVNTINSGDV